MAGACAFDVDENVAARSSNVACRRSEVAATLQRASADLGTTLASPAWRSGPFAAGESGRDVRGDTKDAGQGVVAADRAASKPMAATLPATGRHVAGRDVAAPQHAPGWAGPRPGRRGMAGKKILAAGFTRQRCRQHRLLMLRDMGDGRLFDVLDAEWEVVCASPQAPVAFGRWAMVEPALAGMASPAEAVRSCRAATPAAAAAVLGALLRHAGDPLATRAVLQAVVPALRTLAARRAGGSRHLTRQAWEAGDDFEADVVEVALRRIAVLAGTSPTWPAQAICESTWMTLRAALVRSSRWGPPTSLNVDVANVVASPARSGAEALALAVVGAVQAHRLAVDDARVIYATRVLGHSPAELASAQGRDVRALRAQRARAERRLVDAGWAPRT